MIKLIIGKKGSGKTKKLIDLVNAAAKSSPGSVVCVEKGDNLTLSVAREARLIDVESYGISGYDEYYAMLCGIAASNYDITHIFGDATKKIGGGLDGIENFFKRRMEGATGVSPYMQGNGGKKFRIYERIKNQSLTRG